MGGTTVLPPSRVPRRTKSLAELYSSTPRLRINPACMANPAAPKKLKRTGPVRGGEPQAKRVRGVDEPDRAAAVEIGNKDRRPCPGSGTDLQKSSKRVDSAVIKNRSVQSPVQLCESTATLLPSSSSASSSSMRELIQRARLAKARPAAEEAMEIQRRRMDARQSLEQMVATVEFNDPFIEPEDVCRSRQQLREARQAAAAAEARIVAMARGPVIEAEEAPGCSYFLC